MSNDKVVELSSLRDIVVAKRQSGCSLVLCHGTFDLMHAGHVKHLQRAKTEGDILFVTITADAFVNKGFGRPVFNQKLRSETLAALQCVDYVCVAEEPTALAVIEIIQPDVYVKGSDYVVGSEDITGNIEKEKSAVEYHGGRTVFTDEITFSSSSLLNEYYDVLSEPARNYLHGLKKDFTSDLMIEMLGRFSNYNVLVVGDAIIDEYHYTEPLGQTGKGNLLAVKYVSEEQFAGGAIAVANHVAGFVNKVTLVTGLGSQASYESFIRGKLRPNVTPNFFYNDADSTLVKRRFVDMDMDKLFEVYFQKKEHFPQYIQDQVSDWLLENLNKFDVVLVPDFGNGFISQGMADILSTNATFLAVNAQINSGNRGYHAITRYSKVNFVSLNEPELRLATHSRSLDLGGLAKKIAAAVGASSIAVTRGTKGAMFLDVENNLLVEIPALSSKVVDRIGAGDTFLSMAGLCVKASLPVNISGFVASVSAAMSVQSVCNRTPLDPAKLYRNITTLMK